MLKRERAATVELPMKYAAPTLIWCCLFMTAAAAESGLEYRWRAENGAEFKWSVGPTGHDGKSEKLAPEPFMAGNDFAKAAAVKSKGSNSPGTYDVELTHSARGMDKFRAAANADRSQEYCILFRGVIHQCYALPPPVKNLYQRSSTIYGALTRRQAEALAGDIDRDLKRRPVPASRAR
jgi:hypothetical protein